MKIRPLPRKFYLIVVPIFIALYLYIMYGEFYLNAEKHGSHYLIDFIMAIIAGINLIGLYLLFVWYYIKEKRGYTLEKVYITHCPYCGYEFKYGVAKYCPNCHHRIWRPYRWVWVKKEEEEGENLKIEGGDV